jgi:hypothetical protein
VRRHEFEGSLGHFRMAVHKPHHSHGASCRRRRPKATALYFLERGLLDSCRAH